MCADGEVLGPAVVERAYTEESFPALPAWVEVERRQPLGDRGLQQVHVVAHDPRLPRPRVLHASRAALAPAAPITPPPGCAAAPQSRRPPTGPRYCCKPGIGRSIQT